MKIRIIGGEITRFRLSFFVVFITLLIIQLLYLQYTNFCLHFGQDYKVSRETMESTAFSYEQLLTELLIVIYEN